MGNIVFSVSPRVTKHASDKQATFPQSRADKKCFCCLPEPFACLLLQILSRATKFPMWLNREISGGGDLSRVTMSCATCLLV